MNADRILILFLAGCLIFTDTALILQGRKLHQANALLQQGAGLLGEAVGYIRAYQAAEKRLGLHDGELLRIGGWGLPDTTAALPGAAGDTVFVNSRIAS